MEDIDHRDAMRALEAIERHVRMVIRYAVERMYGITNRSRAMADTFIDLARDYFHVAHLIVSGVPGFRHLCDEIKAAERVVDAAHRLVNGKEAA